jgi:DnaJ-class molecular chaperone
MTDPFEEDEVYDPFGDPDWCEECQGEGKVPTADFESYFGAMYKPCPKCHGDMCHSEPRLS